MPARLDTEHWFQQMLHKWGFSLEQQDCSEFLHAMLTWLHMPVFDMKWERKVELHGRYIIHDSSSQYMPIKLHFVPKQLTHDTCKLQELITTWCQVDGMTTALVCAPQIVCLQLDRMYQDDNGHLARCECSVELDLEVNLPMHMADGGKTETVGYVIVAASAHQGVDLAGHYRSALKIQPTVIHDTRPAQWLITDDMKKPAPLWTLPPWFLRNTTTFMLVRTDCLHVPAVSPQELAQSEAVRTTPGSEPLQTEVDSAQAILALLPNPTTSLSTNQPILTSDQMQTTANMLER